MAGALGSDQGDVDVGRRDDLLVVDREAVAEQQRVAGCDAVLQAAVPDLAVQLVGRQQHHDVALGGGVGGLQHPQSVCLRLGDAGRVGAQPDDDADAGVLEVERVGVALGAVADDRDGLAVELVEVCVVVVEHMARRLHGRRVHPHRRAIRVSARVSARAVSVARSPRPVSIPGRQRRPVARANGLVARPTTQPGAPAAGPPTSRRRAPMARSVPAAGWPKASD